MMTLTSQAQPCTESLLSPGWAKVGDGEAMGLQPGAEGPGSPERGELLP